MALTNLRSYNEAQFIQLSIASLQMLPTINTKDSPDQNVSVHLAGWINSDTMAFKITTTSNTIVSVSLDEINNMIVLNLTSATPPSVDTYWSVNMGSNAQNTDWSLTFDVAVSNRKTGTWTFVKGKMTNDGDFIPKLDPLFSEKV